MTLSKMLTASLLGVMSLSSGALAKRDIRNADGLDIPTPPGGIPNFPDIPTGPSPPDSPATPAAPADSRASPPRKVNVSSASCYVYASAGSSTGGDTIASVAADAAAYICEGTGTASDHDIATATATLFAQAVAKASIYCEASGDSHIYANAYAHAEAEVEDWLIAYASAFASSEICGVCEANAYSYGYIEKYVFLKAVADAKVHVDEYANGGFIARYVMDFEHDVQTAVATAFAEALAGAASYNDGDVCFAWVNAGGCIYTPDSPDPDACFECVAHAASEGLIYEIDAIATASASAAAWTCGDTTVAESQTIVTARALAEATAIAVSFVYASCDVDEGGYACAGGATHIEQSARAVAKAFAEAWARAYNCEKTCIVEVDAAVSSIGEVLVTAATEAYAHVCAEKQQLTEELLRS